MSENRNVVKYLAISAGAAVVIAVLVVVGIFVVRDDATNSTLALPDDPRMLIVGDSYSEGIGAENPSTENWAILAANHYDELGWQTKIDGAGGTGWINGAGGPNTYGERIARAAADSNFVPNILVIQGGLNDYQTAPATIGTAVAASIDEARTQWPGIEVVIFASNVPYPLSKQAQPITDAIVSAARGAGAPVIDPFAENWMTADTAAEYTAGDGTHLTTAGYAYVAGRFISDFSPLFGLEG